MSERIADVLSENAKGKEPMSAAAAARANVTNLVAKVEHRTRSRMLAYEQIARGIGRSVTWVRALVSSGLGRVDGDVGRAIDALLLREIEAEIIRLTHDLETARRCGSHAASPQIGEIETHLAKARGLLMDFSGARP